VAFDKTGTLTEGKPKVSVQKKSVLVWNTLLIISCHNFRIQNPSQVSDFFMVRRRKPSTSPASPSDRDTLVNCTRHRSPANSDRRDHLHDNSESDGAIVLLLRLLLAAEVRSSHPLSKGLVEFSRKRLEEHDSAVGAKLSSSHGNEVNCITLFISHVYVLVKVIPSTFAYLNDSIIGQ